MAVSVSRGGLGEARGFAGGGVTIVGDKALQRKLRHLMGIGSRRALAAAVNAALTPIAREFRRQINASEASAVLRREARGTIGKRFNRGGTNLLGRTTLPLAKVGFAVGKGKARERMISRAVGRRKKRAVAGRTSGGGVGVSAANIHWFVLGTKERVTGAGRHTGRISPPPFKGVADRAAAASAGPAMAAAVRKGKQVIEREARRKT